MPTERRKQLLLAALLGILVFALYRAWQPTAVGPGATSNARGGDRASARSASDAALDVRIETLEGERQAPTGAERNLFRFRPRPVAAPVAPAQPRPAPPLPAAGAAAAGSTTPTTIALKFIGVVEPDGRAPRIAVLSDARGVYHGREGDIIEGRYRIVRIGADSIEMMHLDGRGRQTIRLTGS